MTCLAQMGEQPGGPASREADESTKKRLHLEERAHPSLWDEWVVIAADWRSPSGLPFKYEPGLTVLSFLSWDLLWLGDASCCDLGEVQKPGKTATTNSSTYTHSKHLFTELEEDFPYNLLLRKRIQDFLRETCPVPAWIHPNLKSPLWVIGPTI